MSRLAKTIKNAKVGLFFHVLFIASQFISRKIFLDGLGDEFMGIVSTLGSFLTFINLADLGIGTAIGYTLYKPLHKNDHKEINHIIQFFGHIYKKIGFFILTGSILLSLFFPFIFNDVTINLWLVYLTFFGLLTASLLGYFFNYHMILLQADQKDYIVAKYYQSFNISKILLQAISVYYLQSFVLWISLEVLTGLIYTVFIRKKIAKEYPWLVLSTTVTKGERKFESYTSLVTKIKQISIHKIGEFLASGLDNILIFFFLSAELVAYFANYQLVLVNLGTLVTKVFAGSKASVGNLVAENNPQSIKQVFWEMMVLRYFIGGFGAINIFYLINPFIGLWLGEKYTLSENTIIIFAAIFFLRQIVQPTEVFKQAYGLYDDVWAPIVKSGINLTLSIILVQQLGISGLLIGTFISVLSIEGIWRPYYVYKRGFKNSHKQYLSGVIKLLLTFALNVIITIYILSLINLEPISFMQWSLNALVVSLVSGIGFGFLLYISNSYCRDVIQRLRLSILKK
ncbi:lipopolysaccharide biosynthesis protein [Maribacter ulvicola]|uniref:Membrane protein involved in the export of O-antigen and teichoic acid n=1 Tax=Maribacter ulvicola TaxID=228959 RepID=A0A1N6VIA4_9FLAO|nr:hypothetical protein [Maribacter ulvicola]SIQ77571.1 Membrane protein involved in the export of O-antigen and teichoic acid [Maribacter ulvicola]